jgi:putative transposase
MVRAGVVSHPVQWVHGGHAEIRTPPERYGVMDISALCDLFGLGGLSELQAAQRGGVDESLRLEGRTQRSE